MYAKRVDTNHREIINEFRRLGAKILDTHAYPSFVDAVVAIRGSAHGPYRMYLVEIKNGPKPLRPSQEELAAYWPPECFRVITCIADVTKLMLEHPAAPEGHSDCPYRGELDQCPI